jgi:hypothetical protein
MDTLEALKVIRAVESALSVANAIYGSDKTEKFLQALHERGLCIERIEGADIGLSDTLPKAA